MPRRSWLICFSDALRGILLAFREERSFAVHLPMAAAVVACGWFFGVDRAEWIALVLCVALVIAAELLNTGLERMAKAVTREEDENVRNALDIGAGAVLAASIGAVVCGLIIFVPRLIAWWHVTDLK